jgi:TolB protein
MKKQLKALCLSIAICACAAGNLHAQVEQIHIPKMANHLIAINISGLSGEVAKVVRFDLEVLGMEATAPDKAEYFISGSEGGKLEGQLADATKKVVFHNIYQGGSPRSLAHAFANDIATELRGKGSGKIFKTRIAYRVEQKGISEVVVSDFDGNQATVVTHDNSLVSGLSWGPGGRLFYASWKNGPSQILEHNIQTGQRRPFSKSLGSAYCPSVSPDGRHVAMVLNKSGMPDLYVSDIDGSNLKQLTHTPEEESAPTWSPDSSTICFVARKGRAALYTINIDGGTPKKISISGAYGHITEPNWSSDGKTIVFTSNSGGFTLYAVPATGGVAELLATGEDGAWGPNSRTVMFTRREKGGRVLSLLDVPTKHTKNVPILISGSCSQPDWAK